MKLTSTTVILLVAQMNAGVKVVSKKIVELLLFVCLSAKCKFKRVTLAGCIKARCQAGVVNLLPHRAAACDLEIGQHPSAAHLAFTCPFNPTGGESNKVSRVCAVSR